MGVREGLLALLTEGPKHGYQLRQEFEAATAGVWQLNVGQVYTTLDRLQRDGLVEELEGSGDRRSYRITRLGRDELGDWFSAGPHAAPHREPTVIKVLVALHTDGVDVRQVIDVQRQALLAQLAEQQRARRKALGDTDSTAGTTERDLVDELAAAMVFDALVTRTEADLRWLDLCDHHLASAPTRPRPSTRKDHP
jgi:DNA-binding PadR family transcriptional regulator